MARRERAGELSRRDAGIQQVKRALTAPNAGGATQGNDFMIDNDEPTSLPPVDFERDVWPHLEAMDPDARVAFEKLMIWLSERPREAEPLSQEQMMEMVEDIRLENIRRRLGGRVGTILQFKKPTLIH